jgi:hypothetical protein
MEIKPKSTKNEYKELEEMLKKYRKQNQKPKTTTGGTEKEKH